MTALDAAFAAAREAGVLPNLHAVAIARGGAIIHECGWTGTDSDRGRPLGLIAFGADTPHDMRSVTKSIVGLLYGIALERGLVPPPEAPLLAQFPAHADLADAMLGDPARARLTLAHVLSMTLGTEWDELTLPYTDPRNSEIAMDRAEDRLRYVLSRPVTEPPGQRWTYNGGATALLAALIATGSGQSLEAFAEANLFAPLGIAQFSWTPGPDGVASAASGLRLSTRDLLRIGMCVLADGAWQGRQVVPASWLARCFTPSVGLPDGRRYGWHWYLGAVGRSVAGKVVWERTVSAMGNGGQRLFLLPDLDLAVAVTAGNYDTPDQWRPPLAVLRDIVLPLL